MGELHRHFVFVDEFTQYSIMFMYHSMIKTDAVYKLLSTYLQLLSIIHMGPIWYMLLLVRHSSSIKCQKFLIKITKGYVLCIYYFILILVFTLFSSEISFQVGFETSYILCSNNLPVK